MDLTLHTEIDGDVRLNTDDIERVEVLDEGLRIYWKQQADGHYSDYV